VHLTGIGAGCVLCTAGFAAALGLMGAVRRVRVARDLDEAALALRRDDRVRRRRRVRSAGVVVHLFR
jgi:hypothetical protein